MMLTGVTAAHALTVVGVRAGETVLIHGASGGVGLMAVQLAMADGARVIGTASQSGHELLREFGAEPVLYGAGLEERVERWPRAASMRPWTAPAGMRRSTPRSPWWLLAARS